MKSETSVFTIANSLTFLRIVCGAALLFFPVFSVAFYVLYITAGLTDMVDGTVARKTGTGSAFGAKLDTAADLVLFVACCVKLLPVISLPRWAYIWAGAIALIKVSSFVSGLVLYKKPVVPHTVMNKITGALLFLWPLTLRFIDQRYGAAVVCAVATFAAVQEGHYIRTGREKPPC